MATSGKVLGVFFRFFLFCFGTQSTDWIRKLEVVLSVVLRMVRSLSRPDIEDRQEFRVILECVPAPRQRPRLLEHDLRPPKLPSIPSTSYRTPMCPLQAISECPPDPKRTIPHAALPADVGTRAYGLLAHAPRVDLALAQALQHGQERVPLQRELVQLALQHLAPVLKSSTSAIVQSVMYETVSHLSSAAPKVTLRISNWTSLLTFKLMVAERLTIK